MVATMDSPACDLQAYEPPLSLWKLVESYAPEHEREEIKNMLGESLVDQSLELHNEVEILLEIWRDYREETAHTHPAASLPEPPGVRDRLVQEIQFFVDNVKEKARSQGVNADKLLSRHNTDVLGYALDTYRAESERPSSRQFTARSSEGRDTPMIMSPTCSDRMSMASTLSEEVESMNDKLTILKFDEVFSHLRNTLEEEIEILKKDIVFLQNCLDDEATFRAESGSGLSREPTISDLRDERTVLERELLSPMKSQSSPPLMKPAFTPQSTLRALSRDNPSSVKVKPSPGSHGNTGSPARSGPMKAFSPELPTSKVTTSGHSCSNKTKSAGVYNTVSRNQREVKKSPVTSQVERSRTESSKSSSHSRPQGNTNLASQKQLGADAGAKGTGDNCIVKECDKQAREPSGHGKQAREPSGHGKQAREPSGHGQTRTAAALVTISKGTSGDSTQVHLIPSPPTSAKPPSRPGSAQRFRKMVLDCRD